MSLLQTFIAKNPGLGYGDSDSLSIFIDRYQCFCRRTGNPVQTPADIKLELSFTVSDFPLDDKSRKLLPWLVNRTDSWPENRRIPPDAEDMGHGLQD